MTDFRNMRIELGLSIRVVAQEVGVSESTVRRFERGNSVNLIIAYDIIGTLNKYYILRYLQSKDKSKM